MTNTSQPQRGLRAQFDAATDPALRAKLARQIARSKKRPGDKMMWGFLALQYEREARENNDRVTESTEGLDSLPAS